MLWETRNPARFTLTQKSKPLFGYHVSNTSFHFACGLCIRRRSFAKYQ